MWQQESLQISKKKILKMKFLNRNYSLLFLIVKYNHYAIKRTVSN